MEDCTLCMECSTACESINFKFKKPSFSLFKKFKGEKVEIWAYILILASIPIAMSFHHGIGRSKAAHDMIWYRTAEIFKPILPHSIDSIGLFAYMYAILLTIIAATLGMFIASKILNKPFKETFYNLGYSYAPLFIFASLGHALEGFFTRGYERIVEGFAWAFGFGIKVAPLAKRGDDWLMIFGIFQWIAIFWALVILYKRLNLIEVKKIKKILAFPFAASLIIFYFGVNQYRTYIVDTYGVLPRGVQKMHSKIYKKNNRNFKSNNAIAIKPHDTLFFTDINPSRKRKDGMMGMMMGMNRGTHVVPSKTFWLVTKDLKRPKCVKNIEGSFYATNTEGKVIQTNINTKKACTSISIKVPKSGYYTLYYIQDTNSDFINTTKYEYKKINHGGDEVFNKEKIKPAILKETGFDIIRLRNDNEDSFFYSLQAGDILRFRILRDKKPVEGAKVTLETELGWQKSVRSDKKGIVKIGLIQDYNPNWKKFNKRFREKFIVTVNYKDKNEEFKASYTGVFRPSRETYQSYAYGFIIFLILIALLSIGIFIYRYKVQKPFKEVTFNE
jgi:Ca2+/Na+ antiporter